MSKSSVRWINFNELRKRLKFESVLEVFNVTIHRKGEQHVGPCPLPKHHGDREPTSFSAHLEKGIFQCFGCGAKGNVLDFAALMEGVDPTNGQALRKVAVKIQTKFFPEGLNPPKTVAEKEPELPLSGDKPVIVNAPLDFALKTLQHNHEVFEKRGLELKTMSHFGVGVCSQGVLAGSVAVPLHDGTGQLLGYAGIKLSDFPHSLGITGYTFPARRERKGQIHELDRTLFLYNDHRIKKPVHQLFVVEGFASVWYLRQRKVENVVSIMGPNPSEAQMLRLLDIVEPKGMVWIVSVGDREESQFPAAVFERIAPHRSVRLLEVDSDEALQEFSDERMAETLSD